MTRKTMPSMSLRAALRIEGFYFFFFTFSSSKESKEKNKPLATYQDESVGTLTGLEYVHLSSPHSLGLSLIRLLLPKGGGYSTFIIHVTIRKSNKTANQPS